MQTKVSNNSKRYIYRKNALGRDKSVMGQMTGAVKNYIKQNIAYYIMKSGWKMK